MIFPLLALMTLLCPTMWRNTWDSQVLLPIPSPRPLVSNIWEEMWACQSSMCRAVDGDLRALGLGSSDLGSNMLPSLILAIIWDQFSMVTQQTGCIFP